MTKTILTAEVGVNWLGDHALAKEMIWRAKEAGVDIAKFQLYSSDRLFGPDGANPNQVLHKEMAWMDEVGLDDAEKLAEECNRAEIEFMASSFDVDRLGWLEKIGVKRHKLASRSVKYTPDYCKTVLDLGKETFVSLGMMPLFQNGWQETVYQVIKKKPYRENVRLLYCVSEYPTPLSHINLPEFSLEVGASQGIYGFSDHSEGIAAALVAVARGAKYIEKHVTLDKNLPGPDQKASITFQELKGLVRITREMEQIPSITS